MNKKIVELKRRMEEVYHLSSAAAVLHWDLETQMPAKGDAGRGKTLAIIAGLAHEKFTSKEFEKLITELNDELEAGKITGDDAIIVREGWRDFSHAKKLPQEFVEKLARATSEAHNIWKEARKKSDFTIFLPKLTEIITLKQQEAEYLEYKDSPYDALLDTYERNATSAGYSVLFDELKKFLVPFIKKIAASPMKPERSRLHGHFEKEKQRALGVEIAKRLGYDLEAGRIDEAAHPFATGFNPSDVRITTRFSEKELFESSLLSTIHETGHALYEQGLQGEFFGTPLGEALSLGIHESQSRLWENLVGKSKPFWKYWHPRLQEIFPEPFAAIPLDEFYACLNEVAPSLIRVEADEVTYNLHVILRFEIEKAIIEGAIEPKDLPDVWNTKMKEYLGVDVPNDAMGVLQDVHWSGGSFGYFPTYTLGNLYSAQFFAAAKRDILNLEDEIARGEYAHLLSWLRKNIHIHGRKYFQDELVLRATGEQLTAKYFTDYLEKKFGEIYKL